VLYFHGHWHFSYFPVFNDWQAEIRDQASLFLKTWPLCDANFICGWESKASRTGDGNLPVQFAYMNRKRKAKEVQRTGQKRQRPSLTGAGDDDTNSDKRSLGGRGKSQNGKRGDDDDTNSDKRSLGGRGKSQNGKRGDDDGDGSGKRSGGRGKSQNGKRGDDDGDGSGKRSGGRGKSQNVKGDGDAGDGSDKSSGGRGKSQNGEGGGDGGDMEIDFGGRYANLDTPLSSSPSIGNVVPGADAVARSLNSVLSPVVQGLNNMLQSSSKASSDMLNRSWETQQALISTTQDSMKNVQGIICCCVTSDIFAHTHPPTHTYMHTHTESANKGITTMLEAGREAEESRLNEVKAGCQLQVQAARDRTEGAKLEVRKSQQLEVRKSQQCIYTHTHPRAVHIQPLASTCSAYTPAHIHVQCIYTHTHPRAVHIHPHTPTCSVYTPTHTHVQYIYTHTHPLAVHIQPHTPTCSAYTPTHTHVQCERERRELASRYEATLKELKETHNAQEKVIMKMYEARLSKAAGLDQVKFGVDLASAGHTQAISALTDKDKRDVAAGQWMADNACKMVGMVLDKAGTFRFT